jgi:iron complex outermembrane receptor protein
MYGQKPGNNYDVPSLNGEMFALPRNFAVADAATDKYTVSDKYYRLQLKHDFNDNWHLNVPAAYVQGSENNHRIYADGEIPVLNDTLYRRFDFSDWRNYCKVAQTFVDGKFYTGHQFQHKILVGVDYVNASISAAWDSRYREQKFGLYIPNPDYYINPDSLKDLEINLPAAVHNTWIALYVQDHLKIASRLVVTLAAHLTHAVVRWSNYDSIPEYQRNTKYNVFTPRAGLTWLFSEDVSVYALYDQCFLPQTLTGRNIENEPFKPLTGYNIETGMKSYFFKKKLSLDISLFNIVKNNTVTPDPLHYGYYIQTGQITSKGIDFDMTGNITPALTVNANYEYADAKITKDDDPKNVGLKIFGTPDHVVNLWMKYNLLHHKLKGLSFAMGYQHMGKRSAAAAWNWSPGDAINYLPIYNLVDAALSYHNERLNVGLNVYNITNINYATTGYYNSNTNEWRYTPGEPVNFRLSFGVNLVRKKESRM